MFPRYFIDNSWYYNIVEMGMENSTEKQVRSWKSTVFSKYKSLSLTTLKDKTLSILLKKHRMSSSLT